MNETRRPFLKAAVAAPLGVVLARGARAAEKRADLQAIRDTFPRK